MVYPESYIVKNVCTGEETVYKVIESTERLFNGKPEYNCGESLGPRVLCFDGDAWCFGSRFVNECGDQLSGKCFVMQVDADAATPEGEWVQGRPGKKVHGPRVGTCLIVSKS